LEGKAGEMKKRGMCGGTQLVEKTTKGARLSCNGGSKEKKV